ncbi:hypothetical protein [Bacteroides sp.]|uniref:hypothetical protein n=1 Tax=Bacteroides sp. TaxID=29523 RepID=UPI003A903693
MKPGEFGKAVDEREGKNGTAAKSAGHKKVNSMVSGKYDWRMEWDSNGLKR